MPERVLTQRELNRALLARQHLLERSTLPLPRLVESMGGIQAQYAPSSYIGLWSRLDGFQREDLTRALEERTVVQATLLRTTIHIVSREDFWPLTLAIRERRRDHWLRVRPDVNAADLEDSARRVREVLAEGPRSRRELQGELTPREWNGVGISVELVRAPPSGTWERRRADLFALAESWIPPAEVTRDGAMELLVRRYLGAFGPARRHDVADWAGLPVSDVTATAKRLELRRFRDGDGNELLDLTDAPLPDGDTPAPPRFLPTWDATLLVHARRTQILPERYRPRIFHTKTPHSAPTFLLDGAVAGTWRYENGEIRLEPFEELPTSARKELEAEAERLAAFHA